MIFLQIAEFISAAEKPSLGAGAIGDGAFLKNAAQETLHYTNTPSTAELTIIITDDAQLHDLNHQYRGVDAPTDVLSFPAGETDLDSGGLYLGDILISYPRALAQATEGGHPIEDELQLLVVHGVLHLLGNDHTDEAEKASMWSTQTVILDRLGCTSVTSPFRQH